MPTSDVVNFGRNVRFRPRKVYEPRNESDVLEVLDRQRDGTIRVVASRHAWSDGIVSNDALVDLRHIDHVRLEERDGRTFAVVGAGCQVKRLLRELNRHGLTMPSVGLITEQTIAGATATGTHGSGRHSLSHYVAAARVACFRGGEPAVVDVTDGDELRAVRCSLGCLGIVVEITLPCVPQYRVVERSQKWSNIEEVLENEGEWPLQQFFLLPHGWWFSTQGRRVAEGARSWSAPLYRAWWYTSIDVGLHVLVKLSAAWLRSRWLVHFLFRRIVPLAVLPWWRVTDRSDRQLVMEHELFRHLELEAFVPDVAVTEAARFVVEVLKQADGAGGTLEDGWRTALDEAGLVDEFDAIRGTFTHHYPICFRKILRDDTLISMAAGEHDAWYSISFITYVEPRDDFFRLATFLARSLHVLCGARIHWGKWFPFGDDEVEEGYPAIARFREIAREFDPQGVFQNDFTRRVLGIGAPAKDAADARTPTAATE